MEHLKKEDLLHEKKIYQPRSKDMSRIISPLKSARKYLDNKVGSDSHGTCLEEETGVDSLTKNNHAQR